MSEKTGKIHEVVGDQILSNKDFREKIQEYWSMYGIHVVLPDESMMKAKVDITAKKQKPWDEGTFRILGDEAIEVGDQWAPLRHPTRWRNVADSVGKKTSLFKSSHFRRLTIETGEEVVAPIGHDSGENLVDVECWVWNDGDLRPAGRHFIERFNEVRHRYYVQGTWFGRARPSVMGEPPLVPQHPHKDAGAALIRCVCLLWNSDSINHDPRRDSKEGMVVSFTDGRYMVKDGSTYLHAQPKGEAIVTVPPIVLAPAFGEVFEQTGEAVVGRECWVWNTDPAGRPLGIENAIRVQVLEYKHDAHYCYKAAANSHQFARPVEFGHPDPAQRPDPILQQHVRYGDGKIGLLKSSEGDIHTMYNGDRAASFGLIEIPRGQDLVGKRVWCWGNGRETMRSYIVEKYEISGAIEKVTCRSMDRVDSKEVGFNFFSYDLTNQAPRANSGDELIGVECYVWDERFSAERVAVVSDYNASGYMANVNGRNSRYKNARPVALGVPQ